MAREQTYHLEHDATIVVRLASNGTSVWSAQGRAERGSFGPLYKETDQPGSAVLSFMLCFPSAMSCLSLGGPLRDGGATAERAL